MCKQRFPANLSMAHKLWQCMLTGPTRGTYCCPQSRCNAPNRVCKHSLQNFWQQPLQVAIVPVGRAEVGHMTDNHSVHHRPTRVCAEWMPKVPSQGCTTRRESCIPNPATVSEPCSKVCMYPKSMFKCKRLLWPCQAYSAVGAALPGSCAFCWPSCMRRMMPGPSMNSCGT